MTLECHPDLLARVVTRLVTWATRHPWVVLGVATVLTFAAVQVAYDKLEYHTQRNDLLSADKPCQQRWQKYLDAFGDDDDLIVVVEGTNRERMTAAVDAVAEKVKQRPDLFDRLFYRVDLRHVQNRAILHLPHEQLEAIRDRVNRMELLLGPVGPVAWRMLSTQSLLMNAAVALERKASGQEPSPADRDLLAQLPAIASTAADTLRDPGAYRNPWALTEGTPARKPSPPNPLSPGERGSKISFPLTSGENGPGDEGHQKMTGSEALARPQYFFTPDGSFALLTCRPKKVDQSFTPAKDANAAMRDVLAAVGPQFPEVALGLTGIPVLETDEMDLSDVDSTRASWLALLGVAVLYFIVYRGFRYPLLTIATLVVGTLWALGWATITVGHLNILTATFAVMLIGLGDYGVLWVAQYDDARQRGESVEDAMRHTAAHAGPSIVTAAATTGLAFFAVMLADFKAVAELGWIAGSGVLFCAASCILLMPALLVLVEKLRARCHRKWTAGLPIVAPPCVPATLPFRDAWLPGLSRRPRLVLGVGAVLLLACGAFATRLTYDHNLLKLQASGLDSVAWERKLIDRTAGATWDALSIAHDRNEALALKARYEAIPEVSRVVEVASLVPDDQPRKLVVIQAIHDRLANLPPLDKLPLAVGTDPEAVKELTAKIARLAGSDSSLARATTALASAVASSPEPAARLQEFDRRLAVDLATELHRLKAVSHPAPITLDDVPAALRERYVGANGEYLVRAFARDSLWDYNALREFTNAANAADAQATGKAFRTQEGLRQMKVGFEWAALYALIAIVIVLLFDLRRLKELALGLFPLAVGVILTLGVMGLCGISLNPANMIALPLIVGVGVDNGVHVLHDYRARSSRVAYRLGAPTGRGVLVAALTTILGFGTLIPARHQGMSSLGLVLTLGVTFCMVAALVFLPAILRLRDVRRIRRERITQQRVLVMQPRVTVPPVTTAKAA